MAQITKQFLTGGAADGTGIKVVATATAGTLLHTVPASSKDEIYLWATNSDSTARILTIEFGGVTDPDDLIEFLVPATATGLFTVIPGIPLDAALVVRAFAATTNVISIYGFVNRIA